MHILPQTHFSFRLPHLSICAPFTSVLWPPSALLHLSSVLSLLWTLHACMLLINTWRFEHTRGGGVHRKWCDLFGGDETVWNSLFWCSFTWARKHTAGLSFSKKKNKKKEKQTARWDTSVNKTQKYGVVPSNAVNLQSDKVQRHLWRDGTSQTARQFMTSQEKQTRMQSHTGCG